MISFTAQDSSFFKITVENMPAGSPISADISSKVISFSITESKGKMMSGDITLYDDDYCQLAFILKMGRKLKITWGYFVPSPFTTLNAKKSNPTEISGMLPHRTCIARIKNPTGDGGTDGKITYSCSFMATETTGVKTTMRYIGLSKDAVIRLVMTRMGILPAFQFVKFGRGLEISSMNTAIIQDNLTDFKFLNQYSLEWGAMFRIGYNPSGAAVGLFADYDDDLMTSAFLSATMGTTGISNLYEYKLGIANVKSYKWQYNSSEGGGDNVQLHYDANGKPQFTRTVATTEGVAVYKLNSDKISAEMSGQGSVTAKLQYTQELLEINDFETLVEKGYFIPSEVKTAPQGTGLTVDLEVRGNPFVTAPARAKFGKGFPDILSAKITKYVTSVTHKIDKSGYNMSVSVADIMPSMKV